MSIKHTNFAFSTVATAPSPTTSGTSLVVASGEGALFPTLTGGNTFNAVICPANTKPSSSNAEVISVTARSTDTFTIVRAQEGSSARDVQVGDYIYLISSASEIDNFLPKNVAITGATKTKITYDANGLVTSGADATTADIADSTNKRYVSDAQLVVIGNTSGTNTGDQTSMTIDSTPDSDHTASGLKAVFTAAAAMAFGDIVYFNGGTVNKMSLIDADAIASSYCIAMCADATIAQDASGNFLLHGFARDDSWNFAAGSPVYASVTGTTGNTLTQTAPTGVDDCVVIVGIAVSADVLYFCPSLNIIERT